MLGNVSRAVSKASVNRCKMSSCNQQGKNMSNFLLRLIARRSDTEDKGLLP